MYSEKDFQNIQDQLITLKEDNYKLIDACRKFENEKIILKQENISFKQDAEKANKIIEKNKIYKDISSLANDYEGLHLQMQHQEEQFKLQNGIFMKELQEVADENEKFKNEGSYYKNHVYLLNQNIENFKKKLEQILNDNIKNKEIETINQEFNSLFAHETLPLNDVINNHNTVEDEWKNHSDLTRKNLNEIWKTLRHSISNNYSSSEMLIVKDNINQKCSQVEFKLNSLNAKFVFLKEIISRRLIESLREVSDNKLFYEQKIEEYENRIGKYLENESIITTERDKVNSEKSKHISELKSDLESYLERFKTAQEALIELNDQLSDLKEKELNTKRELEDLKVFTDKKLEKSETELQSKENLIKSMKSQLIDTSKEFADMKMELTTLKEDHHTRERKLNMQIKDLKKQFAHEKKKAENLQEYISSMMSKSFPSTPQSNNGGGTFSILGINNSSTTSGAKNGSPTSLHSKQDTNSSINNNNNNYGGGQYSEDEDRNSVSSWSVVSNGHTPSNSFKGSKLNKGGHHNHSSKSMMIYGSPYSATNTNGAPPQNSSITHTTTLPPYAIHSLNGSVAEITDNLESSSIEAEMTDDINLLRERVKYLEESAAGLAEDLMRKTHFIERCVEKGDLSPSLLNALQNTNNINSSLLDDHHRHGFGSFGGGGSGDTNNVFSRQPTLQHLHHFNAPQIPTIKRIISQKFNNFIQSHASSGNNNTIMTQSGGTSSIIPSTTLNYDELSHLNNKLKIMLEETLTKNIMLEKNLEKLMKENSIMKNLRSAIDGDDDDDEDNTSLNVQIH